MSLHLHPVELSVLGLLSLLVPLVIILIIVVVLLLVHHTVIPPPLGSQVGVCLLRMILVSSRDISESVTPTWTDSLPVARSPAPFHLVIAFQHNVHVGKSQHCRHVSDLTQLCTAIFCARMFRLVLLLIQTLSVRLSAVVGKLATQRSPSASPRPFLGHRKAVRSNCCGVSPSVHLLIVQTREMHGVLRRNESLSCKHLLMFYHTLEMLTVRNKVLGPQHLMSELYLIRLLTRNSIQQR